MHMRFVSLEKQKRLRRNRKRGCIPALQKSETSHGWQTHSGNRAFADPAVTRYTGDPGGGFVSVAHALEILRSHPIADYWKHRFGRWACVEKTSGRVIGFAGLKHLDDMAEVDHGYRLLPASWGLGVRCVSTALDPSVWD